MKIKKTNYKFPIAQVIEDNLTLPSIKKSISEDFGIKNCSINIFKNSKFIAMYNNWDEDKKNKFTKTIGGIVYFKKIKEYINSLEKGNQA